MKHIKRRSFIMTFLRCICIALLSLGAIASAKKGGEIATLSLGGLDESSNIFVKNNHRQNFCDSYDPSSFNVTTFLSGKEIHPAIQYGPGFIWFNYTEEGGIDPDYPGLIANLLDEIADRANFTWRQSFGVFNPDDKADDTSFTEILELYADTYDISIDKWIKTTERLERGLSYVDSWFDADLVIVHTEKESGDAVDLWSWMEPFDATVWWITLATIFGSAIVYQIIEYLHDEGDGRSLRKWSMDNIYFSILNFNQNYSYEPKHLAGKVFGISFSLWGMLIGATYTANLASLLVKTQGVTLINTLEAAMDTQTKICVHGGSATADFVAERLGKPYSDSLMVNLTSPKEMYVKLTQEVPECGILVGTAQEYREFQFGIDTNPNCNIEWIGRGPIRSGDAGFVTKIDPEIKCTSIVNEVFNYYLSQLKEEGIFDTLWSEHYDIVQTNECSLLDMDLENENGRRRRLGAANSEEDSITRRQLKGAKGGAAGGGAAASANGGEEDSEEEGGTLNINQMAGTFFIHLIGSIIAIVMSLLSKQEKKMNVKRHSVKVTHNNDDDENKERLANILFSNGELAGQMNKMLLKMESLQAKVDSMSQKMEEITAAKNNNNNSNTGKEDIIDTTMDYKMNTLDNTDVTTDSLSQS